MTAQPEMHKVDASQFLFERESRRPGIHAQAPDGFDPRAFSHRTEDITVRVGRSSSFLRPIHISSESFPRQGIHQVSPITISATDKQAALPWWVPVIYGGIIGIPVVAGGVDAYKGYKNNDPRRIRRGAFTAGLGMGFACVFPAAAQATEVAPAPVIETASVQEQLAMTPLSEANTLLSSFGKLDVVTTTGETMTLNRAGDPTCLVDGTKTMLQTLSPKASGAAIDTSVQYGICRIPYESNVTLPVLIRDHEAFALVYLGKNPPMAEGRGPIDVYAAASPSGQLQDFQYYEEKLPNGNYVLGVYHMATKTLDTLSMNNMPSATNPEPTEVPNNVYEAVYNVSPLQNVQTLSVTATPETSPTPTVIPPTEAAPKDGDTITENGKTLVYKEFQLDGDSEGNFSGLFSLNGKFPMVEYNDDPSYLKDSVWKEVYFMKGLQGLAYTHPEDAKGTMSGALLSMMFKELKGSMTRVQVYDQALAGTLRIPFTDSQGKDCAYVTGSGDKTYVVDWVATEGIDAFKQWTDPYGGTWRSFVTSDSNNALITVMAAEHPDSLSDAQKRIPVLFGVASILSDSTQKDIGFTTYLSTLVSVSDSHIVTDK